ncbi:hypothetical protein WME76_17420 [Sorangium sp. So ce119]|uniref:hypothetical protein n=1 Tax=Sorangium sp. So ce119 TaxID=3133279 RepID=UPI003F5D9139
MAIRHASVCVIAMTWIGCAQIFGFDKEYLVIEGPGTGGAGGGSASSSGTGGAGGAGGAGGGDAGGGGAGGEGAGGAGAGAGGAGGGGAGGGCVVEMPAGEPPTSPLLIDDMEDGDNTIIPVEDEVNPRRGYWYVANDANGLQNPAAGDFYMSELELPRGDSTWAVNVDADEGFTSWGALFGVRLNTDEAGTEGLYDASGFRGISFWAYAESGSYARMIVDAADVQTWEDGGICGTKGTCDDHFRMIVALTPCWKYYEVPFADLKQTGWGEKFEAVDVTQLWAIQFRFNAKQQFNVWVDDVAFYK